MNQAAEKKKLGTFLGVFTPTILTILGVILFLRSGWLVGHLGLWRAILAVSLANAITLITTLSFSSVATNLRVGVGGAYYIVSRSLGLEFGGAIGWPLFFSQVFSVTLYSFGLAESLRIVFPHLPLQQSAFIIVIVVGALAFAGAGKALKAQLPFIVLIAMSLIVLAVGAVTRFSGDMIPISNSSGEVHFWMGFAVFFPAVTGVMAGLSLSGDLKNPERSIPIGSIAAVVTGFLIYLLVLILLVIGAGPEDLRSDTLIWLRIAKFGPWLILPGLWGAIFSSAIGSMLGAPRTLQALAIDRIAPRWLGDDSGEPKKLLPAFALSLVIALIAVFLGDLNVVAQVVTMFFLTVYGTLNFVAATETLSGDPSWRPLIRIPWPANLLGGFACVAVMFLINPIAGVIAFVAEFCLWFLLSRKEKAESWGDARRGIYETLIRRALIHLSQRPMSARNWRPHILIFVSDPLKHLDLIRFGDWFCQGRGVVTVCELLVGNILNRNFDLKENQARMQKLLDQERLIVFPEVDVVNDIVEGIINVAQANGMAGFQSNTLLLGWPKDRALLVDFLKTMESLECLEKSFIIARIQPRFIFPREGIRRTIHVWWGGLQRNGDLMLLLAYLLTRNAQWRDAQVKVMSIASNELTKTETVNHLNRLIPDIHIPVEPHVMIKPENKTVNEVIRELSNEAEVVFFGLATPDSGQEQAYAERLEALANSVPGTVFFVKNSCMFVGELLNPSDKDTAQMNKEE